MSKTHDPYDQAVAWLRERPYQIGSNWNQSEPPDEDFPARILFSYVTSDREARPFCGCLTLIRGSCPDTGQRAETPDLTAAIRADNRLPGSVDTITVDHLPVFAEWMRTIDAELRREPPVWLGPEMFAEARG